MKRVQSIYLTASLRWSRRLFRYMYTGEYDPELPVSLDCNLHVKRSEIRNDVIDRDYSYEFPHTCTMQRGFCD